MIRKQTGLNPPFQILVCKKSVGDANLHVYCDRDGIAWTSNWAALWPL